MTTNSLQQNIPQLRFPGFEGEWKAKKLDSLLKYTVDNRGKTPPIKNSGIPLIEVNAIGEKDVQYSVVSKYVNQETYDKWFRNYLKNGDVLFSTVGRTALLSRYTDSKKAVIAQNIVGLRASDHIDNNFLYYLLKEERNNYQFKKIEMVAVQPSVKISQMIYLKFYVPEKTEQQKIASFLTAVDDKISVLDKKVIALKQYKKGIMQKIFSQQIRFRDENGGLYASWKEVKLGDLGSFKSGIGFPESQQGRCFGIPFYKVSDMNLANNETTMTTSNNYVDSNQIRQNKYNIIDKPSIIFAKVGAAIFLERKRKAENFLIDNNMMAFIPNKTVNYEFINFTFQKIRLSRMAQSGALPSYNGSDLKIIKISIPARISEQQKIANFLTAIDQKITAEESKLKTAKEWKKGLMQRMFV